MTSAIISHFCPSPSLVPTHPFLPSPLTSLREGTDPPPLILERGASEGVGARSRGGAEGDGARSPGDAKGAGSRSRSASEGAGASFDCTPRGTIEIKGKGTMNTYWLEGVE